MKNISTFIFGLLLVIILGSIYLWFVQPPCCTGLFGDKGNNATTIASTGALASPLLIKDGNNFMAQSPEGFTFSQSDFKPTIPSATQAAFQKLGSYLKQNPNKKMTLTGRYAGNEKYSGKFENLGVERANAIKQKLVALGANPAQINLRGIKDDNIKFTNGMMPANMGFQFNGSSAGNNSFMLSPFTVTGKNNFKLNFNPAGLSFDKSKGKGNIDGTAKAGLQKMAAYLKANPSEKMTLKGYYSGSEKYNGKFDNLGVERANSIKEQLVALGANANQFVLEGIKNDNIVFDANNKMRGGVNFSLGGNNSFMLSPFTVTGKNNFKLNFNPAGLSFDKSKGKGNIDGTAKAGLQKMAAYLKANPSEKMTLKGYYSGSEKYNGKFDNLGVERANSIKEQLVALGANANQFVLEGIKNDNIVFDANNKMRGGVNFSLLPNSENAVRNLVITDTTGDTFKADVDDDLVFKESNFEANQPLSPKVKRAYQQAIAHLKKHPNKELTITGWYGESEKNNSLSKNLGLGRANNVKQLLVSLGANSEQIKVASRMRKDLPVVNGQIVRGVDYTFENKKVAEKEAEKKEDDARLKKIEADIKAKPRTIYFETNKSKMIIDAELRQYFTDLLYYLDKKPNVKVRVTGHTDSQGDAAKNMILGKKRADFAKDYLVKNGIRASQLMSDSKGETKPIADNNTAAGRSKNRRTTIELVY